MRLNEVIHGVEAERIAGPAPEEVQIRAVTADSRRAGPGTLFVAVPGTARDGHDFAAAAVAAGCPAVLVERPVEGLQGAAVLQVRRARRALALCAANLAGRPAERMELAGVTGTNGKTTVTWLLEAMALAAGRRPGVLGTTGHRFGGKDRVSSHTTPGPEDLQPLLAEMAGEGVDLTVMEVSSHALDQDRVAGLRFSAAGFTNLTRDHLDYHGDLEGYFEAKARLFTGHLAPGAAAVINVDDAFGRRLAERLRAAGGRSEAAAAGGASPAVAAGRLPADLRVIGLSVADSPAEGAELQARDVRLGLEGIEATLALPGGATVEVRSRLVGAHNLQNIAVAAGLAFGLGLSPDDIAAGLARCAGVPGRLERVPDVHGRHVFVDYAHTDDAIRNVVSALRALAPAEARILVVFGCGGDRDRGKRPLMGRAAAEGDLAVVTSDNPRTEDPRAIIDEILPGLEGARFLIEPDRRAAIEVACATAREGDVVLIAGKGHETYQQVGAERRPFDDREVAREALARVSPGTRFFQA